jgi:hypothetical protein
MDIGQARELVLRRALAADPALDPDIVDGNQYVRVADGAMEVDGVLGRWYAGLEALPITGWQIDAAAQPGGGYGMYSVDELMAVRPVWVVPLILGQGWSFHCDGDTLVDVLTPDGQLVSIGASVIRGSK